MWTSYPELLYESGTSRSQNVQPLDRKTDALTITTSLHIAYITTDKTIQL